ncbi:uncharacterized protein BO72DRAFT_451345 [Aspergillus fijiensis CBS 313.89]|uniref:Uncharacterized protein n=1 Tax=Aspergillus fijiensis CBS 313.89 TaxID=1448319 RepID=A0A8G1VYA1_9EURO|nr:uncharacterized protein BO72DRAFT_451345 [Aspergillus fijiensis CBS 313.89]RAK73819.1 hypothetical protein BO72DRAFT_451345 [Aspergillus fijiensis CBS 313.89]
MALEYRQTQTLHQHRHIQSTERNETLSSLSPHDSLYTVSTPCQFGPSPFLHAEAKKRKKEKGKRKNPSISSSIRTPMKTPSIPQRRDRMSGVGKKKQQTPPSTSRTPSIPTRWLAPPPYPSSRERETHPSGRNEYLAPDTSASASKA